MSRTLRLSRGRVAIASALALLTSSAVAAAPHAGAATTPGPSITMSRAVVGGEGFDVCDAPPTSEMRAWLGLPFRTVNIYFAGSQRLCKTQSELTADWVTTVMANGWNIIPTVVDLQAPCYTVNPQHPKARMSTDRATARSQGAQAAINAINGATSGGRPTSLTDLGFPAGSIAYIDMEHYNVPSGNTTCVPAVRSFLAGWTTALHNRGYRSGVYSTPTSGIKALVGKRADSTYPQPDAIWFARYDGVDSVANGDIPSDYLPNHRIHQYLNTNFQYLDYPTVNIDKNRLKGDVMTRHSLKLPAANTTIPSVTYYAYAASTQVATSETLKERVGPSTNAAQPFGNKVYANGAEIDIVCQAAGTPGDSGGTVHGDYIWDKLVDGNYVSDLYTNTTGGNGVSSAIPHCETAPPTVTVTPLRTTTLQSSVAVSYSAKDPDSGVSAYDVRWHMATDRGGFGGWHYPATWQHTKAKTQTLTGLTPGNTYCISVRAYDRLTNRSGWSPGTCIVRAMDDRALVAGASWHRQTGTPFFLHTVTSTTIPGARLSRGNEQLIRVGIVATKCPTCGKVRILVAGKSVG